MSTSLAKIFGIYGLASISLDGEVQTYHESFPLKRACVNALSISY